MLSALNYISNDDSLSPFGYFFHGSTLMKMIRHMQELDYLVSNDHNHFSFTNSGMNYMLRCQQDFLRNAQWKLDLSSVGIDASNCPLLFSQFEDMRARCGLSDLSSGLSPISLPLAGIEPQNATSIVDSDEEDLTGESNARIAGNDPVSHFVSQANGYFDVMSNPDYDNVIFTEKDPEVDQPEG